MSFREEIKKFIEERRDQIERFLKNYLEKSDLPELLINAIKHIALNGGKRFRGTYLLFITELFDGNREKALKAASAVELFHSALLVYDDLPAMDNAMMRRGKPAVHRVFGEDIALLAGLAMINSCVEILHGLSDPRIMKSFTESFHLLIWGQTLDLRDNLIQDEKEVEKVYEGKTASLFVLAAEIASYLCDVGEKERQALCDFSRAVGVAYQMVDDLIDLSSSPLKTGKDVGKDRGKRNAISFLGSDGVRRRIEELRQNAFDAAERLGERGRKLCSFADFLLRRSF